MVRRSIICYGCEPILKNEFAVATSTFVLQALKHDFAQCKSIEVVTSLSPKKS